MKKLPGCCDTKKNNSKIEVSYIITYSANRDSVKYIPYR